MKENKLNIIDNGITFCLGAIAFFLPITPAALEVFSTLAILLFITKKIIKPDFLFLREIPNVFLLIFLLFSGFSLINSGGLIKKSIMALLFKWIEYVLLFIITQDNIYKNRKKLIIILSTFLFSMVITGIDGICQRITGLEFLRNRSISQINENTFAITGPFKHYNDFGAYLVIAILTAIGILLSLNKRLHQFLVFSLNIILVACTIFTFSRGAWLGLAGSLILLYFLSRKNKMPIFIIGVFVIFLLLTPGAKERKIFSFIKQSHQEISQTSLQEYKKGIMFYDSDRFNVWNTAFAMIKENPFLGKGVGTFMDNFSKYDKNRYVQYAHNCFLQIWAETGIFALLAFLLFLCTYFYTNIKSAIVKNDYLAIGVACGLIGFLVHSFFDTNLYSLQLSILFWLFLGLISQDA